MHAEIWLALGVLLAGCSSDAPVGTANAGVHSEQSHDANESALRFDGPPSNTISVLDAGGNVLRVIEPVVIHEATHAVECAVSADIAPVSNVYCGSCDSDAPLDRPWRTVIDLTDDGLRADNNTLIRMGLIWGDNQGIGGRFSFCRATETRVDACQTAATNGTAGQWWLVSSIGKGGGLWNSLDQYDAYIKFPPCSTAACAQRGPTVAQDWTFTLQLLAYPGLSLAFG